MQRRERRREREFLPAVVLVVAGVLAGCGGSDTSTSRPLTKLSAAVTKFNDTRRVALSDLALLDQAVHAERAANQSVLTASTARARDLVPHASDLLSAAAPLAARSRSDVLLYENALDALVADSRKAGPTDDVGAAGVGAIAGLERAGHDEADAIRASGQAYADGLPAILKRVTQERAWIERERKGSYRDPVAAIAAYTQMRGESDPALEAASLRIDAAAATVGRTSTAMVASISAASVALGDSDLPPLVATPRSPSGTPP